MLAGYRKQGLPYMDQILNHTLTLTLFSNSLTLTNPLNVYLPCSAGHSFKRKENVCLHRNLNKDVCRKMFIYNSHNQTQPRCSSMGDWLNALWLTQSLKILFSNEKECVIPTYSNQEENLCQLYDSLYKHI